MSREIFYALIGTFWILYYLHHRKKKAVKIQHKLLLAFGIFQLFVSLILILGWVEF